MKTLSVKDVAGVLGLTKRAVMYRLENGKLKGTRVTNSYGQEEWRIYPNKEIMQAVEAKRGELPVPGALNFEPDDAETVDAEAITSEASDPDDQPTSWRTVEMERLEIIAEKLVKPLTEKLAAQAMALREKDLIIEDQSRQLKLLPDLEKKAREAEEDRKAAEIRALEAGALKKQIEAMQLQVAETHAPAVENQLRAEKEAKESELQELRSELERQRQTRDGEIKALEEKLSALAEYRKVAEESQRKLDDLHKVIEERDSERAEGLKRLQEEKDTQATAIMEELAALSKKIDRSQQPEKVEKSHQRSWWKTFLGLN